jgi:hypothetical protein
VREVEAVRKMREVGTAAVRDSIYSMSRDPSASKGFWELALFGPFPSRLLGRLLRPITLNLGFMNFPADDFGPLRAIPLSVIYKGGHI